MRLFILLIALSVSSAFACGGPDIAEKDVRESALLKEWKAKLETKIGKKLTLREVRFSGNDILNIDGVSMISAMCAANYIYPYFTNKDGTVCMVSMESGRRGGLQIQPQALNAATCRLANHSMVTIQR